MPRFEAAPHVLNAKKSRFVGFHSFQSLLTESLLSVLNAAVVIWGVYILLVENVHLDQMFITLAIFACIWNLMYCIFSIIACIHAKNGRFYYFWVIGRISFNHYYSKKHCAKSEPANTPPQG